ncbi:MAG: hypothetical protein Q8799_02540 [Candidatus Phytoplasma australasiaticum]|nr:hypothetical protein [Candidatus Phytoplasma australasiaticum]MDV3175404.1 hypothetical protein [Candidatus Phytoplasma australasiaticum]
MEFIENENRLFASAVKTETCRKMFHPNLGKIEERPELGTKNWDNERLCSMLDLFRHHKVGNLLPRWKSDEECITWWKEGVIGGTNIIDAYLNYLADRLQGPLKVCKDPDDAEKTKRAVRDKIEELKRAKARRKD